MNLFYIYIPVKMFSKKIVVCNNFRLTTQAFAFLNAEPQTTSFFLLFLCITPTCLFIPPILMWRCNVIWSDRGPIQMSNLTNVKLQNVEYHCIFIFLVVLIVAASSIDLDVQCDSKSSKLCPVFLWAHSIVVESFFLFLPAVPSFLYQFPACLHTWAVPSAIWSFFCFIVVFTLYWY